MRDEIKAKLEALGDDEGRPIGTRAPARGAVRGRARASRPTCSSTSATSTGAASAGSAAATIHVFENDTGPDDANHAHEGLYILVADGVAPGPGDEREIRDIAPTILELLGEPVLPEMEGASLV